VICYPNVVIKPLCGNLDICLNYWANANFGSQNSVRVLSVALLTSLADFATEIHFGREKAEHVNAPVITHLFLFL